MKKYKFVFLLGAHNDVKEFDANTHIEAWKQANDYINKRHGECRACYCISIDDKDTGTLRNLESLFKPKIKNKINSLRATDLI